MLEDYKDDEFQRLLNILAHFSVGALEEVVSFDQKDEKGREEVLKVSLKSCEVSAVVLRKLGKIEHLDWEKIEKVESLLKSGEYDLANEMLNN